MRVFSIRNIYLFCYFRSLEKENSKKITEMKWKDCNEPLNEVGLRINIQWSRRFYSLWGLFVFFHWIIIRTQYCRYENALQAKKMEQIPDWQGEFWHNFFCVGLEHPIEKWCLFVWCLFSVILIRRKQVISQYILFYIEVSFFEYLKTFYCDNSMFTFTNVNNSADAIIVY